MTSTNHARCTPYVDAESMEHFPMCFALSLNRVRGFSYPLVHRSQFTSSPLKDWMGCCVPNLPMPGGEYQVMRACARYCFCHSDRGSAEMAASLGLFFCRVSSSSLNLLGFFLQPNLTPNETSGSVSFDFCFIWNETYPDWWTRFRVHRRKRWTQIVAQND